MAVSQSLSVTQSSQSVSGNYSKVRILWKSTQSGASYNGYTLTGYYWVAKNGGSETKYSVGTTLPKSSTKTIVDKTITVDHRTDGTGSVKVRTSLDTGISAGTITKSESLTLDTIPRATQPTVSASSVYMGAAVTINTPRASSSFTHDLAYSFAGGSYVSIDTGVGTSKSWTVPDLASKIPKAISGVCTIRCITKQGSTTIGTKTVSLTLKVPTSVVPTISAVNHSEAVEGLAAQFGAYVQNKSKLSVSITAAGAKGSTITDYEATFAGTKYTGKSWTSAAIKSSGTLTLKVRVKDSRGRWSAYESVSITVLAYSPPEIWGFSAYRCNADGTANDSGTYMAVAYNYNVTPLGDKNTAAAAVKYKRSTDTSYTELLTDTALRAQKTQVSTVVFSTDYQYDVQLTLEDWFGAVSPSYTVLPSDKVIMDIKANGLGIAFGKTAESDGVDFGWDIVKQLVAPGSLAGQYKTHDGILLQWGTVSITPSAVGTPTKAVITFEVPFGATPLLFVEPVTSVPQKCSLGVLRSTVDDPKLKHEIVLTRDDLTNTVINWFAVGKAVA